MTSVSNLMDIYDDEDEQLSAVDALIFGRLTPRFVNNEISKQCLVIFILRNIKTTS
jgi:hypothetical protein